MRESGERGLPHHRRRRVRLPARLFGYAGCGPSRPRGHDRARAARRGGRDEARQNDRDPRACSAVDGDADAPYYRPSDWTASRKTSSKAKPQTDRSKCTGCGVCAALCPMDSISREDPAEVTGVCIKCHACVRNCPTGAKYFDDEAFLSHKAMLERDHPPRRREDIPVKAEESPVRADRGLLLHRKLANTEAPTTVSSPATTMDRRSSHPPPADLDGLAVPSACGRSRWLRPWRLAR